MNENTLKELTSPNVDSKPHSIDIGFHKKIIEYWTSYGIMVLSSQDKANIRLRECFDQLPVQIRKIWKTAYKYNKHKIKYLDEVPKSLPEIESILNYRVWSEAIDVFEASANDALKIGIDESRFSLEKDNIEFIKYFNIDESKCFSHAKTLSDADIQKKCTVNDVWKYRFSDLVDISENIVIVDRYAVNNFMTRKDCGLRRFIKECSEVNKSKNLTIVSSPDTGKYPWDPDEVKEKFLFFLSNHSTKNFNSIDLYLVKNSFLGFESHDRYIRFDKMLCDIGIGLEILEGQKVMKKSTFRFKSVEKERRILEKEFIREARSTGYYIKLV